LVTPAFSRLPAELRAPAADAWSRLADEQPGIVNRLLAQEALAVSVPRVWALSEFVGGESLRHPEDLEALVEEGGLVRAWEPGSLAPRLAAWLDEAAPADAGEEPLMAALRIFRRREMMRIAWRDYAGSAALEENLGHLSELADVCISAAATRAQEALARVHGEPRNTDGSPLALMILAMGKLGGGELNFSSDVDLVFLYETGGETDGPRPLSHEQYFARLGQRVIRLLDEPTDEGRAFRVDLRLRPFGQSGPLAMSLPAFQAYLQGQGRPWERYAYVKARPVTGWARGVGLYREILDPFVYRRYLDYGLLESLRDMKSMVAQEVARRDLHDNIKLGPGGIREIEFIVQSIQLLRGGRDRRLRQTGLLPALAQTRALEYLDAGVADELETAYRFLRSLENRLQAIRDEQTHDLPAGSTDRARLALAMGKSGWADLQSELAGHRRRVEVAFRNHVDTGGERTEEPPAVWPPKAGVEKALAALGFSDPGGSAGILQGLAEARWTTQLDETGRRRLDTLVPGLIADAAVSQDPDAALARLAKVLTAIGRRSAYYALLNENEPVRSRLAQLCGQSDFLADQVALHPLLLDELIDPRLMPHTRDRERLEAELAERLAGVEEDDLEAQMEALRNFQRAAVFSTAVADLSGVLPVMKVSDRLSDIAEVILGACTSLARAQMEVKHGRPRCGEPEALREAGFAVIGYGKLGGIELGYGSDLDLVFVHDSEGSIQETEGPASLDCAVFFARMTRRMVHLLSTQTASGALYEVDTRLRPSGKGGLMVSSLSGFEEYQRTEAWTWEHQALLRARAVAGDPAVRAAFETLRGRILTTCVDLQSLRERVAGMRDRMRGELSRGTAEHFDLKQDRGGITDVEFLVQYWVLKWCNDTPELVRWSDNVRQLESLAASGLVPEDVTTGLMDIYLAYRRRLHHGILAGEDGLIPAAELAAEREWVAALWSETMRE
jgi:glutamate-ammonia-ligase adenylyltransferase